MSKLRFLDNAEKNIGKIWDKNNLITSYHDKSDGGLFVTLSEMALSGNKSIIINKSLEKYYSDILMKKFFFNEELGVVVEVSKKNNKAFFDIINKHNFNHLITPIGKTKIEKQPSLIINSEKDF